MMKRVLGVLCCVAAACAVQAKLITIENGSTALVFDDAQNYAPVSMVCKATGVDVLSAQAIGGGAAGQEAAPWKLVFRKANQNTVAVTAASAGSGVDATQSQPASAGSGVDVTQSQSALTVRWKGLRGQGLSGAVDFMMSVSLRDNGDAVWTYGVSGTADAQLWQVDYPIIRGIRPLGEDYLADAYYIGRLMKNPTGKAWSKVLTYPQPCSMQFCAYWGTADKRAAGTMKDENGWQADMSDATGLYFAAEDPAGFFKQMRLDAAKGHLTFSFANFPAMTSWPMEAGMSYDAVGASSYPVVTRVFKGDVFTACAKYGAWAAKQPWCSAGRMPELDAEMDGTDADAIVHWKSRYYRNASFWTKFYEEPYKILPEWDALQSWLRVPSPSHWYRYNQALFDDNYPEHLPGRPFLQAGARAAKRMGVYPQPYNNGVIWDMDTQSWFKEHGEKAMRIEATGNHRVWNISNEYFAFMCPYTAQWQAKMRETNEKQIWEQEMSGVYLDCLAATASSRCFNPDHGHPIGGGSYFTAGNRKLLYDLRRHVRKGDADAGFFVEEINEQYLDCLDGFLTLDYLRPGYLRPGEQVFPLFNIVYNPYMMDFGSDTSIEQDTLDFHLQMARLYVWGCTPLVCSGKPKAPQAGDANSEFLKSLVQGYYLYGRELTFNADVVRMSRRPMGSVAPSSAIDVQATPVSLVYKGQNGVRMTWNGPAVLANAFRKGDAITLLMANVSDAPQVARITVAGTVFDGTPAQTARVLWPAVKDIAAVGASDVRLPANSTAVVTFWKAAKAAVPKAPELLKKDWLLVKQPADGLYPSVDMPKNDFLYACDDAIVQTTFGGTATARMMVYDDSGRLLPRRAIKPEGSGPAFHAKALRRERVGQPFALLHEIPFRAFNAAVVNVLAGDSDYISCVVTPLPGKKSAVWQQSDGIVVAGNMGGRSAKVLGWASKMRTSLTAAGIDTAQPMAIGIAQLTMAEAAEIEMHSRAFGIDSTAFLAAYRKVVETPSAESLGALSKALMAWYQSCARFPGMFAPKGVGFRVLAKVAALQAPFLPDACLPPAVLSVDDWLSPGISKGITLAGTYGNARVMPLGNWQSPARVSELVNGSCTLMTTDYAYIERVVPVAAWAQVFNGGVYPAITWLQCNAPYELQTQALPVSTIGGTAVTAAVTLRNWSTLPLKIAVKGRIDKPGFKIENPTTVSVPPRSNATVAIAVTVSESVAGGDYVLAVEASHAPDVRAVTHGAIKMSVMEKMRPLSGKGSIATAEQVSTLRGNQKYGVYLKAGEQLKMRIENAKVTIYKDGMTWLLLNPEGKEITKGVLQVGAGEDLNYTAAADGLYILECKSGRGAARVSSSSHPVSEGALLQSPMALFSSKVDRYFYVKAGASSFKMNVEDGGEGEPAAIRIISPTGRVALDRSGRWRNESVLVDVKADEAGKVWKVEFRPEQDVELAFYDGAESWLARTKDSVVRGNN